jgi:hypothetical protein
MQIAHGGERTDHPRQWDQGCPRWVEGRYQHDYSSMLAQCSLVSTRSDWTNTPPAVADKECVKGRGDSSADGRGRNAPKLR